MLYREDSTHFPFNESHADFDRESLLMPSRHLRYDRGHGGVARDSSAIDDLNSAGEAPMDITGPGSVGGARTIRPAELRPAEAVTPAPGGIEMPIDEVEISSAAEMLERLSHDPRVREARLAEIQAQIAAGSYETPEKLEAAVMRMLSDLQ